MQRGGMDLFLCDVTVPATVSAHLLIPCCVLTVCPGKRGENGNLFHTAITPHHDIEPTLPQRPSALTVKMSDKLFSSEGNPI